MEIADQAPVSPEFARQEAILPRGMALLEVYELELTAGELPDKARAALTNESANVTNLVFPPHTEALDLSDPHTFTDPVVIADLQRNYTLQAAHEAGDKSWWNYTQKMLGTGNKDKGTGLKIFARHTLRANVDGEPLDQAYEIFEVAEPVDEQTLQTVYKTLEQIDQFSGGSLVAGVRPLKLLLCDTVVHDGKNVDGINKRAFTAIGLKSIREGAKQIGADEQQLIAQTLVHELLGHQLERTAEGDTNLYFPRFFDYSDEKVEGSDGLEGYSLHENIKAKEPAQAASHPVAEYGHSSAAEDLAMSVEATTANALGLTAMDNSSHLKMTPDAYRDDLSMALMETAAKAVATEPGTPGIVGSAIRYVHDDKGALKVEPVRTFSVEDVSGQEAVAEEIRRVTQKYQNVPELIVDQRDAALV